MCLRLNRVINMSPRDVNANSVFRQRYGSNANDDARNIEYRQRSRGSESKPPPARPPSTPPAAAVKRFQRAARAATTTTTTTRSNFTLKNKIPSGQDEDICDNGAQTARAFPCRPSTSFPSSKDVARPTWSSLGRAVQKHDKEHDDDERTFGDNVEKVSVCDADTQTEEDDVEGPQHNFSRNRKSIGVGTTPDSAESKEQNSSKFIATVDDEVTNPNANEVTTTTATTRDDRIESRLPELVQTLQGLVLALERGGYGVTSSHNDAGHAVRPTSVIVSPASDDDSHQNEDNTSSLKSDDDLDPITCTREKDSGNRVIEHLHRTISVQQGKLYELQNELDVLRSKASLCRCGIASVLIRRGGGW
eukprot:PhM_4_TR15623/c0_g1_i1/m.10515